MQDKQAISELFQNFKELPCWQAWRGYAATIFLEFGDPIIEYEPGVPDSETLRERFPFACVKGSHWLQLNAYWKIFENEKIISGAGQSDQQIDSTLKYIRGRKLQRIYINAHFGRAEFYFDYNLKITVVPYPTDMNAPAPEWATPERWQELLREPDEIWALRAKTSEGALDLIFYHDGNFEILGSKDEILRAASLSEAFEIALG